MQQKSQTLVSAPSNPVEELTPQTKKFYQFHGVQMIGSDFPTNLIETLHLKLTDETYDGGQFFQIIDNEETQTFEVRAKMHIPAKGNVFLIDHALTFRYPELRQILRQNSKIVDRLEYMLKYHSEKKHPEEQTVESSAQEELQLDNMDLIDVRALQFPPNLMVLSLCNNKLQNPDELISKLQYLNLKVLWLNGNPVAQTQKLKEYVETKTRIEMFNSKFTKNCTQWAIKYVQNNKIAEVNKQNGKIYILNLDDRDVFKIDTTLFESFTNLRSLSLKGHSPKNQNQINILLKILHFPTLRFLFVDEEVQKQLREAASKEEIDRGVMERLLINKHSFKRELVQGDERFDQIYSKIFRISGNYRLASTEQLDQSSCWYVNDELGSCIPHSDHPKVKLIPFLYAPNHKLDDKVISFSLLWPLEEINVGDYITRDFLNGIPEEKQRSARLAAWYKLPEKHTSGVIEAHQNSMLKLCADSVTLMQNFYNTNATKQMQKASKITFSDKKLKVFSDYEFINKYLKHEQFQIVDSPQNADVIWKTPAVDEQEWQSIRGKDFVINQFPFESCVVMKQNLANTIQSVFGQTKFLMRTYDLEKELKLFISDFYQKEKEGVDNLWILKPPNMARSIDMIITDNLSLIIRAMQTGPKIAQKYISTPVLRRGKKVDLRYILLVKSISPLNLFLYKNFWIRSANNDYTLDRRAMSTYETQFTVMNYGDVTDFKQIQYQDFIEEFQKDYKVNWAVINDKIKKMLRNTFIGVATKYPQMHNHNSRAVYGIDIMIDAETMEPKLLEITFSPDCKRACEYYPPFYDNVFHTLYLETMSENMERII